MLNPYEAPQSLPPPPHDPHRWRRLFGTFVQGMSLLLFVSFLVNLAQFLTMLPMHRPSRTTMGGTLFSSLAIGLGLWFAGQYFRQTGRRPEE